MALHPKRNFREGVDEYGRTELHYASLDGEYDKVNSLIADGLDVDLQDDGGFTPLHFASQDKRHDVVALLLVSGANPNLHDRHGNSPLWTATMNARGEYSSVEELLKSGSDPLHLNYHGKSPFDFASTVDPKMKAIYEIYLPKLVDDNQI